MKKTPSLRAHRRGERLGAIFGLGMSLVLSLFIVDAGLPAVAAQALPSDVRKFRSDRALCDHFRGEEADSAERRRFLSGQLQRYCTGTDNRLRQLKQKYRSERGIQKILEGFEPRVE